MANYELGRFSRSRVEAFSDGLFAIVVTLLVFELKFPHIEHADSSSIWGAIVSILPKLAIWITSFITVCVIWMNHHRVMEMFKGIDAGVFWLNNILLMFTSLVPFPTMVIGDYPTVPAATCFYGMAMGTTSLAFFLLRYYVHFHPYLLKDDVDLHVFKYGSRLALIYGPGLYLLGAALGFISTWLAFAVYFFIPVYFIFPRATRTK